MINNLYNIMRPMNKHQLEKFINNNDDNSVTLETLLFVAYDLHKYEPDNKITEKKLKRQYQYRFRKELENRYKKCIISKKSVTVCEACHIIPFSESDHKQIYDVNNGLLMSADLHKLFDKYIISIDNDRKLVFAKNLLKDSAYKEFRRYDDVVIDLNKETMQNMKQHYEKFLELNNK
jgi:predicted restriction endonuclease